MEIAFHDVYRKRTQRDAASSVTDVTIATLWSALGLTVTALVGNQGINLAPIFWLSG